MQKKSPNIIMLVVDNQEQATLIYEEIKAAYPDFIQAHSAMLQSIEPLEVKKLLPVFTESEIHEINRSACDTTIEIANAVISVIDVDKLLINLAIKNDQRPDAAKIKR